MNFRKGLLHPGRDDRLVKTGIEIILRKRNQELAKYLIIHCRMVEPSHFVRQLKDKIEFSTVPFCYRTIIITFGG